MSDRLCSNSQQLLPSPSTVPASKALQRAPRARHADAHSSMLSALVAWLGGVTKLPAMPHRVAVVVLVAVELLLRRAVVLKSEPLVVGSTAGVVVVVWLREAVLLAVLEKSPPVDSGTLKAVALSRVRLKPAEGDARPEPVVVALDAMLKGVVRIELGVVVVVELRLVVELVVESVVVLSVVVLLESVVFSSLVVVTNVVNVVVLVVELVELVVELVVVVVVVVDEDELVVVLVKLFQF